MEKGSEKEMTEPEIKDEKPTPKKQPIELVTQKTPTPKPIQVTVHKFTECPYCGSGEIGYDSKLKIYYCFNCKEGWQ